MPGLHPEPLWEDGLLLRPQHLQTFQRHCKDVVAHLARTRPFGYGVRALHLRKESVGNWLFEVLDCDVVMPDGSVVLKDETALIPPVEFRHARHEAAVLDVWLGVPLASDSAANLDEDGQPGSGAIDRMRRFVAGVQEIRDENSGSDPQDVRVKHLNCRLFVGRRPPDGFVTLKIAELRKVVSEGEEGTRYELSDRFVPACLCVDAAPALVNVVLDLLHELERKNEELVGHVGGRRDLLTGDSIERPDTLLKLQATNGVLPVLRQVAAHGGMHPFDVYLQLARVVGDLAIFGDDWRAPKLVIYDHDDPLQAYADLKQKVVEMLKIAVETTVERAAFGASERVPGAQEVAIPAHWLEAEVELYLGFETARPPAEVAAMFTDAKTVLAAPDDVAGIRLARIEGIGCALDPDLHPALRDRRNLVFLRIDREGDLWQSAADARVRRLALKGPAAADPQSRPYLYATNVRSRQGRAS